MKTLAKVSGGIMVWALPALVFAQQTATDLVIRIKQLINLIIPIMITVVVILIIVNVIRMTQAEGDDKGKYQSGIIKGIIGLFVVVALWGIINILINTIFGSSTGLNNSIPSNLIPTIY